MIFYGEDNDNTCYDVGSRDEILNELLKRLGMKASDMISDKCDMNDGIWELQDIVAVIAEIYDQTEATNNKPIAITTDTPSGTIGWGYCDIQVKLENELNL